MVCSEVLLTHLFFPGCVRLVGGLAHFWCSSSDPPDETPGRGCPKVEVIFGTKWVGKGREGVIGYEQGDTRWNKVSRWLKWIWEGLFEGPLGFEFARKRCESFFEKTMRNLGFGDQVSGPKNLS